MDRGLYKNLKNISSLGAKILGEKKSFEFNKDFSFIVGEKQEKVEVNFKLWAVHSPLIEKKMLWETQYKESSSKEMVLRDKGVIESQAQPFQFTPAANPSCRSPSGYAGST